MNEIKISKRVVILSLVLLGAAAAAGWGAPRIMGWLQAKAIVRTTPIPTGVTPAALPEMDGREAAIAGARQFYSVDYSKGQQAWLDNLCAVSTQIGCLMDQNVIAPNLWGPFVQAKTVTKVQVTPLEKFQDQVASTRGNAPLQIWRLQIQLSAAWPMQKPPQTAFPALALVIQENGVWKFERFLTTDEMAVFSQGDLRQ